MKRREFIGLAAAGAAGLAWPASLAGADLSQALAQPHLIDVLHDARLVRELGRHYRATVPKENNRHALTQTLLADARTATPEKLRRQLREQVCRDFDRGRTVTLNGWILSVTEARQCALYSMLPA